ncbi:leucyl aminopeptidase [Nanoarchaeota archaeon]
MKITVSQGKPESFRSDLIVIGLFEKESHKNLDKHLDDEITSIIKSKEFTGEFGQTYLITTLNKIQAKKILLVGLGKTTDYSLEILRRVAALSAKYARALGVKEFATTLQTIPLNKNISDRSMALVEGTLLGLYRFNKYITLEREKIKEIESMIILDPSEKNIAQIKKAADTAQITSEAVNYTRDLVNLPAAEVTPTYLANEAKKLKNLKVKILGRKEMEKAGMNCILAVGKGSEQEPKFIVMEYNASKKGGVALVGKGVSFDSGGLDLKPGQYMGDMKSDMAGAAAVLGVMKTAAQLKIKQRVIGIIPTVENMPGSAAYKPGDIITAYNGKTIEVTNTDAEGRLILADALSYAEEQKPNLIVDLATLTGACVVALGYWSAAIFGDEKSAQKIMQAGEEVYERVWRLPMYDEYKSLVKSTIADVKNNHSGYDAGAIEGAMFLSNFVEKTNWVHIDIAGTSWFKEDKFYISKGGTGFGVRLMLEFLRYFY